MPKKIPLTGDFWEYLARASEYYDSRWRDMPEEHYREWMASNWGIAHRAGSIQVIDPALYSLFLLKFGS